MAQPRLGPAGWARFLWRQLTSMRTALLLLLLVAIAAIPGSVFPQRAIDLGAVDRYLDAHPTGGRILDALQMFDVYTSVWFSAIYLLLVVSLVGCIIPRTMTFWRQLAAPPPAVPRRPERIGPHLTLTTGATPEEVVAQARALMKRRYRLRREDDTGPGEVAAERGYLREAGNILFHYGVVAVIVALAAGYLVGWKGDRIVSVGEGFANTRSSYFTFSGGPLVDGKDLQPFLVHLDDLAVRFEQNVDSGQVGAPREFKATTTVRDTPGAPPRREVLEVNHPLQFDDAEVYLLANGYSPVVTVRDASGKVVYSQPTPFLPQDANYRSTGAVKVPAALPKSLGLSGVFLPTAVMSDGKAGQDGDEFPDVDSAFPDAKAPVLVLSVYEGNLFPDAAPQSVYALRTTALTQVKGVDGKPLRLMLRPGDRATLPGGRGTVEFERLDRWVGISTRYDPVKDAAMWSSILMLIGLIASLLIKRRRVFIRATPQGDGSRVLVAGLAQREDAALGMHLRDLASDLVERLPAGTKIDGPDPTEES